MTREEMKNKIFNIIDDTVWADAWDDSGLHIIKETVEEAAEKIMKLWDKGFTYDLPKVEDRSGESMYETLIRNRYR